MRLSVDQFIKKQVKFSDQDSPEATTANHIILFEKNEDPSSTALHETVKWEEHIKVVLTRLAHA